MTLHRHHSTPVSQGGIGPIQLLEDRDHAYVHFRRFVSGEDKWFHGGLLKFLCDEDQEIIRQLWKERGLGKNNPMFGVPSPVSGWKWWTNGDEDIMSETQPGPSWKPGRTAVNRGHDSVKGQFWFNNGNVEVLDFKCPDGFSPGRLPLSKETKEKMSESQKGLKWWNDGNLEVQSINQPNGFIRGRLLGHNKKQVEVLDVETGEKLHFASQKECYTFFQITKKVFRNRLAKQLLIRDRYQIVG